MQISETPSIHEIETSESVETETNLKQPHQQLKRGQKSKLKKIKEKYKDQDDEERELRMKLLQSDGPPKPKKNKKEKKSGKSSAKKEPETVLKQNLFVQKLVQSNHENTNDNDNDDEEIQVVTDVDMIDSLTGLPVSEDELLFAIPVVAPYTTLVNYKYVFKFNNIFRCLWLILIKNF